MLVPNCLVEHTVFYWCIQSMCVRNPLSSNPSVWSVSVQPDLDCMDTRDSVMCLQMLLTPSLRLLGGLGEHWAWFGQTRILAWNQLNSTYASVVPITHPPENACNIRCILLSESRLSVIFGKIQVNFSVQNTKCWIATPYPESRLC